MSGPAGGAANDRVLNMNEAAISTVRREVAAAVEDINRALSRLQQVLDDRMPELRAQSTEDPGREPRRH